MIQLLLDTHGWFSLDSLQDTSDPVASSLLQPQSPGTLVLELDWLPTRTKRDEPLVLCIAGADSSFRLIEINVYVNFKTHCLDIHLLF